MLVYVISYIDKTIYAIIYNKQRYDKNDIMGLRLLKRLPLLSTAFLTIPFISVNRVMATLPNPEYKSASSIYEFTALDIKGKEVSLDKYRGHICLIVNVASQCGLTANNYKQLNELFEEYGESKGLRILAFPCNQFNAEEPGNAEDIVCFASERKVKFDMFDKINVNGDDAHPLYKFLKHKQGGTLGSFIKWNFTKFIIDKNGVPVERHGPNVDPKDLVPHLEKYW